MKLDQCQFWADVGYTHGSMTMPKVGDVAILPTPDLIITDDLYPSRERLFSAVKVKADYLDLISYGYIAIDYLYSDNRVQRIYGWITGVKQLSDTPAYHEVEVQYDIDYWRTYAALAVFKEGMVMRRPLTSGGVPPQNYAFIKKTYSDGEELHDQQLWWLYFVYTKKTGASSDIVVTNIGAVPFFLGSSAIYIQDYHATVTGMCPTSDLIGWGAWDEFMKIDPEAIKIVGVTHVAPFDYTGTGSTETDPIRPTNAHGFAWSVIGTDDAPLSYRFEFFRDSGFHICEEFDLTLSSAYESNDYTTAVVTGYDGEPVGTIPWGFSVHQCKLRTVVSTSGIYTQIRFNGIDSHVEGLCFTVPAVTVEMCENAWSSYVYSGQRQYDIESRKLGSLESLAGSAASSTLLGAMISMNPIGAVAGLAAGVAQGALELGVTNGMEQDLSDKLHAQQTAGLIMPGAGFDFMRHGRDLAIVNIVIDAYSATQRDNDISIYGAHVKEATADCQSLITAGGPLQIASLNVGGPIPPEAKSWMMRAFSQGVRLA